MPEPNGGFSTWENPRTIVAGSSSKPPQPLQSWLQMEFPVGNSPILQFPPLLGGSSHLVSCLRTLVRKSPFRWEILCKKLGNLTPRTKTTILFRRMIRSCCKVVRKSYVLSGLITYLVSNPTLIHPLISGITLSG